ncbi:hypothetical protein J3E74DRAFT_417675 [Bipolaris maydis]|nr:hypothetical protein J3E74DRAFT_417675 [Bipolaris maydis]
MHFLKLLLSTLFAAGMAVASPAPMPLAESFEPPWPATGPLSGSLPKNMAKIWVFDDMRCDDSGGRTYMVNVMPGQDRCLAFTNVGSIFSWFKSDIGKCEVSVHSGSDCKGWKWTTRNKACSSGHFASVRVKCPKA